MLIQEDNLSKYGEHSIMNLKPCETDEYLYQLKNCWRLIARRKNNNGAMMKNGIMMKYVL